MNRTSSRQLCSIRYAASLAALATLLGGGASVVLGGGAPTPGRTPPAALESIISGYTRAQPFNMPAGVFYDRRLGELYVADRGNHKVEVFDQDGLPLRSFVHMVRRTKPDGTTDLLPGEPNSVAVTSEGNIFIVDGLEDVVDVVSYRGRSLKRLRVADLVAPETNGKPGPAAAPVAVTVDEQDRAYIALSAPRSQVVVLDPEYRVLRRIGSYGRDPGQFSAITSLSVDTKERLLVTDALAIPVQVFSPEGTLLLSFGKHDVGWQNFSLPNSAVRDGSDCIWVVDTLRHVVTRFDDTGRFIGAIGGFGTEAGDMTYPVAITGDAARRLYVLEKNGARVQVFRVTPSQSALAPVDKGNAK